MRNLTLRVSIFFVNLSLACSSESPSFTEKEVHSLNLSVKESYGNPPEGQDSEDVLVENLSQAMSEQTADTGESVDSETSAGTETSTDTEASAGEDSGDISTSDANPSDDDDYVYANPQEDDASPDSPSQDDDNTASLTCENAFKGENKVKFVNFRKLKTLDIESGDIIAIKINGNKEQLDLHIMGNEGDSLKGLCLFLSGNQSKAHLKTNLRIKGLIYIARGNLSSGHLEIQRPGEISAMHADLAGNSAKLTITGEGSYPCDTILERNASAEVSCQ